MHLLILGLGYSATRIAAEARAGGWRVTGVRRQAGEGVLAFDDPALPDLVATTTHLLSSVPPDAATGGDPVLSRFASQLAARTGWTGYLSSTGVYGDTGGAWVDEGAPTGQGRRTARSAADLAWQQHGAVFRLPGIYGPGRSALDQVRAGTARRVDRPGHMFSRIHVDDIAGAVLHAMRADFRGILNVADDLPAEPRAVAEAACALVGAPLPPLLPLDMASLSPMARGFWTEQRRVANGRLTRTLGYRLKHPDYRSGLLACLKEDAR